jgi:hypothetical protein
MDTTFTDPFDALFNLQRALEARLESGWLHALSDQVKRFLAFFPIYPHSVHSCLRSVAVVGVAT